MAYEDEVVRVVAAATDHRPVQPTVGYRIEAGGHAVVLAGDTVPCAGLDELCRGAEALVCTVVRDDLIRAIGVPRLIDVCDYHSTVEQAADTAARAGVSTLVLTHCVPPIVPGAEDEWRDVAAACSVARSSSPPTSTPSRSGDPAQPADDDVAGHLEAGEEEGHGDSAGIREGVGDLVADVVEEIAGAGEHVPAVVATEAAQVDPEGRQGEDTRG